MAEIYKKILKTCVQTTVWNLTQTHLWQSTCMYLQSRHHLSSVLHLLLQSFTERILPHRLHYNMRWLCYKHATQVSEKIRGIINNNNNKNTHTPLVSCCCTSSSCFSVWLLVRVLGDVGRLTGLRLEKHKTEFITVITEILLMHLSPQDVGATCFWTTHVTFDC